MKPDVICAICLLFPALDQCNMDIKNIPPPMPTTPEIQPNIAPVVAASMIERFRMGACCLSFTHKPQNMPIPLSNRTLPKSSINTSVGRVIRPPRYAIGMEVVTSGRNARREKSLFLYRTMLIVTTLILHSRATIGICDNGTDHKIMRAI